MCMPSSYYFSVLVIFTYTTVLCFAEAKETSEHVRPPPPPPPLPPPPPPLPTLLVSVDTQVTPLRPRKPLAPRNDIGHPLSAVLSEMKNGRPKLKPIERLVS